MTDNPRFHSIALTGLRVFAGLAFAVHGSQKLLGLFGGFGPNHGKAELMSRFGAAGIIETVAGVCIALGLFTRPLAFIASGEMAVAYLTVHLGADHIWWWQNGGEVPLLYSFIWLFFSAHGAGPYSLDAKMNRGRGPA
ncbi:MAG: DoxX family protein [Gemmatimonadota bacterium]